MTIEKYCKGLGMDLQEFRAYKQAVKDEAQTIYDRAKKNQNTRDWNVFYNK